jgi:hypothetical protein
LLTHGYSAIEGLLDDFTLMTIGFSPTPIIANCAGKRWCVSANGEQLGGKDVYITKADVKQRN